jgi:hypothetical protein
MPIPFDNTEYGETPGAIGFLRVLDEEHSSGIRGALLIASAKEIPLEFCFTRVDHADSVLWREGEARRVATASLVRALFLAASRTPDVILGLADEIPPLVFSGDIRVGVPFCRVSTDPAPRRGASEEIEKLDASLFLIWSAPAPADVSAARRLLNVLANRPNPLAAFERVAAGIEEAYAGRSEK